MTNPGNAIGTNGAYSGRTSVNAFNDDLSVYSRGVLSGWSCSVSSGLTVALGGVNGTRDVAVATDNNGNNTTINNISESPVNVTISSAPATESRVDAIVAYVDNPPQGVSTTADNPNACGLIVVKGTAASSPIEPSENTIRSAITADGASGTTAYYVVLAEVTIASGTTDLDASNISQGESAKMTGGLITEGSIDANAIDWNTTASRTPFIFELRTATDLGGTITSDKGNIYGYQTVNNGSGLKITSGAENVNKVVTTISFRCSQTISSNVIGVHSSFTAGGTNFFKFISGLKDGTVVTAIQKNGTYTSSYAQANYNTTAMTFTGAVHRTEWIRMPEQNRWYGFFEINYYGVNTTYYGVISADPTSPGMVPTLYQPGVSSYVSRGYQSIEIYE